MILTKTVVLVGLMGAGKTRVGLELARQLSVPFHDSDREIESAADMKVAEIFERFGEDYFRKGEKRVIERLLKEPPCILATGGGAFVQDDVRALIKQKAISVWLRANLDTLSERTGRTSHRPLLSGDDREEKLKELIEQRYPLYAEADVTIDTDDRDPRDMARIIWDKISERAGA